MRYREKIFNDGVAKDFPLLGAEEFPLLGAEEKSKRKRKIATKSQQLENEAAAAAVQTQ